MVVVTGIGLRCCLGTLSQSWQNLLKSHSGIKQRHPFPELPAYPLGLIDKKPVRLNELMPLLVTAALKDAGIAAPLDCGVVIGSSRGCQADWELATQTHLKQPRIPFNWQDTLPHQGAIATARLLGSTGPVLAPMAACATGIWAIAQGVELIQTGQCQRVVAGAVEAPITPLTLAGFERIGALAKTGAYPFARHRQGLVLGEGGAVFVLESAELALRRNAQIYGQIGGFGLTCDAYHVSAPDMAGHSAVSAVNQCLARSHLSPAEIDYIHAHGTGTRLNDQREAQLIQKLFPQRVPVSSTKGATGHTLGASGALGIAFCLMALTDQQLPPCVGLQAPEFDLDFVTTPRQNSIENIFCFSFGFGGQNAAIALKKWHWSL